MVKTEDVRRGDVFLVSLDPARGGEIQNHSPCCKSFRQTSLTPIYVLLSWLPDTGGHPYPFRVSCRFEGRSGYVMIDQIRTVDRERLARRFGKLSPSTLGRILVILQEMFTP